MVGCPRWAAIEPHGLDAERVEHRGSTHAKAPSDAEHRHGEAPFASELVRPVSAHAPGSTGGGNVHSDRPGQDLGDARHA